MRRGFNFYRSYYDVFKELSKKDKLDFIEALLDRQFTGKEPELEGLAKFAYLSQKHSIDTQIKGFEDKTGEKLYPYQGGSVGGSVAPSQQEKEQEKEEENINISFIEFWNKYNKKNNKSSCEKKWNKLKDDEREQIIIHLDSYIKATPDKQYRKNPDTYLNQRHWENEIEENLVVSKPYIPTTTDAPIKLKTWGKK